MTSADRAAELTRLALELRAAREAEPTADAVISQTLDLVPDADWVSLTVRVGGGTLVTLAATGVPARAADEIQYGLGEGPCVSAARDDEWYRSGAVHDDPRWPRWGPRAADLGIRSLLSIQLATEDTPVGALNMYSARPGGFSDRDDVDFAVLYGAHVAVALAAAREISGLHTALHSRHAIGLAQGMLMERLGLSVDASFNLLRRYSSQLNLKLADVAAEIVDTGRLPDRSADESADESADGSADGDASDLAGRSAT